MAAPRVSLFLLFALAMVAAVLSTSTARAQIEICGVELIELVNQCVDYVLVPGPKANPSKACCVEVCKLDVPCFCGYLPPETEESWFMVRFWFFPKVPHVSGSDLSSGRVCGYRSVEAWP
ncbi:hypothetical protein GW17_00024421 [Ensete ventricosum]|nr:hypothetical protein GW17_00024421 [Ensete ventricosum]